MENYSACLTLNQSPSKAIRNRQKRLEDRKERSNSMQNPPKMKEPIHSLYSSQKEQVVATSFMLDTRKDLAMLRKASSGIANTFKAGYLPSGMA